MCCNFSSLLLAPSIQLTVVCCGVLCCAQVLPSLHEHRDEVLLKELLNRWNNHKVMVRWLSRFFNYLDRWARVV